MKKILIAGMLMHACIGLYAQKINWQNLDLQKDTVFGISTEKAYNELLNGKKSFTVIVAIIDAGIDTAHEDLKSVLWSDPKTGHHGWNYIGPETGREDVTILANNNKALYDSLTYTGVPEKYRAGYREYRKAAPALEQKLKDMNALVADLEQTQTPSNLKLIELAKYHLWHGLNVLNKEADTATGNADVSPDVVAIVKDPNLTPYHGTHVAGIIGADRTNTIGMKGVADHVQLMMLKTNGNIRELRDKGLADAIRFAVDHGAQVINMSFGKSYTWNKKAVDDAVKYAMEKDVLLIHAAGNNGDDLDVTEHYPNPNYADGSGKATAWLEVGASRPYDDTVLMAAFSNHGKHTVDVFAPGTGIYSTIPGNKYDRYSGTSMAAPVVAGLAALIREYYPKLTAVQVKDIIMQSVVKVNHKVYISETKAVPFSEVCVSGGVVNAYNALKLAATIK